MKPCVVVLPCFNEAERLQPLEVLRLARHPAIRVICVDDGSTDATPAVLTRLRDLAPESINVVTRRTNGGRGAAVRDGMRAAIAQGALYTGFLDADLAAPVDEMLRLYAVLDSGETQAVLGARVRRLGARVERSAMRRLLGRAFANLAALAIDVPLYDTQCGAKLFRVNVTLAAALAEPFTARWTFDVELIARLFHGTRTAPPLDPADFVEVPLGRWRDVAGSKLRARDAVRALVDLVHVGMKTRRTQAPVRDDGASPSVAA